MRRARRHHPVGLVMPIYNQEPDLLERAVDSVFRQTLWDKGHLQVCFVLDGPNEPTRERFQDLLRKNQVEYDEELIIVDRNENMGIAHSLNQGYAMLNTRYASWASSDNDHDPEWLEDMYRVFNTVPLVDIVFSKYRVRHKDGSSPAWADSLPRMQAYRNGDAFEMVDLLRFGGALISSMYRLDCARQVGVRAEVELAEDFDFAVRYAKRFSRMHALDRERMTFQLDGEHSYTTLRHAEIVVAVSEVWQTEVLPLIQQGLVPVGVRYYRPDLRGENPLLPREFYEGGSCVRALLVPKGRKLEYAQWAIENNLFVHMLIEEG